MGPKLTSHYGPTKGLPLVGGGNLWIVLLTYDIFYVS